MEDEAACFFVAQRRHKSARGSATGVGGSEACGGRFEGENQDRSKRPHRLQVLRHRPSEHGRGADIGMQRFVAQAFGRRRRFDCFDANFIGVIGGKMTH